MEATDIAAAGRLWDAMEISERADLIKSLGSLIPGRMTSAKWERVDSRYHDRLAEAIMGEDAPPTPTPKNTDPTDRTVHAGWSDGKPVYRASMAGRCIKELFLWRIGAGDLLMKREDAERDPVWDISNPGILGAREGTRHEQWMVEDLLEQGYEIAWAGVEQRELERRYKRFVVRSHPDGMIRGLDLGDVWRVLECKAMNEDRYALWESRGWDGFSGYAHQVSLEMELSGSEAVFLVKNRNTGDHQRLILQKPPIDPRLIIKKFSKIEDIIEAAEDGEEPAAPECPDSAEWFFCPFFNIGKCDILEGKDTEELQEVEDSEFASILKAYRECKLGEKKIAQLMAGLRTQIIDRVEKLQQDKLRVTAPWLPKPYFAAYTPRVRKGFDIPAAKQRLIEKGEDPSQFDKETAYMELRVTGGPKESEDTVEGE